MMPARRALPARRRCENFAIGHGGLAKAYQVTVGYYEDGRLGEVFINGGKSGEAVESIARDGAVLMSIALQYGATIETLAKAITRDTAGRPQTIVGVVLDRLLNDQPI